MDQIVPEWKASVNHTLALLRQSFPRTFVALVAVPDVGEMGQFANSSRVCSLVQSEIERGHCPLGGETVAVQVAMNTALQELQDYWSDTVSADDFAVVYQPFMSNLNIPNATYLSALDCFHPGQLGHAMLAKALWNNLVTPRAQKRTHQTVEEPVICGDTSTLLHVD